MTPADAALFDEDEVEIIEKAESSQPEPPPQDDTQPPDFANLAQNRKIVKKFLEFAKKKYDYFVLEREPYDSNESATPGIWIQNLYMFACGRDQTRRAAKQDDDTLADTGSVAFYRQVCTIAAQLLSVFGHRKELVKFTPIRTSDIWTDTADQDRMAKQHTALFHKTLADDGFTLKFIEFVWQMAIHGNIPTCAAWLNRTRKIRDRVMVRDGMGKVTPQLQEREILEANRPTYEFLPIESVYCDPHIPSMVKQ